jgi:heme-degrading monooxygenase HmoA
MILEVADIRIKAGQNEAFEAAIGQGVATVMPRAEGYRGHRVVKGIESANRYVLLVWWDTLEDHTVKFRGGPLFAEWRSFIGPFFDGPPSVEHFDPMLASEKAPS